MKKGTRLINCARGGLVDEAAVKTALDSGQLAGAAFDVFAEEPAKQNALFGNERVVLTLQLGASTSEAQENVALQVAEQISDYLLSGRDEAIKMHRSRPKKRSALGRGFAPDKLGAFAGSDREQHRPVEMCTSGGPRNEHGRYAGKHFAGC